MQEQPLPVTPAQAPESAPSTPIAAISWQASEYVTREKNTLWFIVLAVVTLALVAVALFLVQDVTFAVLIVVMAVAVGLFARRPARDMSYALNYQGLTINGKFFDFKAYRAFGVVQEGALYSITLLPRKRFAPGVNVYFPPEQGEQIVDMFGAVLPMEHIEQDFIDRLGEKLHF